MNPWFHILISGVILLIGTIWQGYGWYLKSKDSDIEASTNNIAVSHNQSGGITANLVNIETPRRKLDAKLKRSLLNRIDEFPDHAISIATVLGDQEALGLAQEVKSFLLSSGFNCDGVNQEVRFNPEKGLFIEPTAGKIKIFVGSR